MTGRPVRISIEADSRDAVRGFDAAGDAADRAARDFDGAAEGADTVASKGAQAAGAMGGLGELIGGKFGGGMQAAAIGMQAAADAGDLVNVAIEGGGKAAAKAVGFVKSLGKAETYTAAAKKASAAAQWALNAAMTANPIGLVILAVVALVAAFVIAYKKSETFRNIVQGAMKGVQVAIGWVGEAAVKAKDWVVEKFDQVVGYLKGMPGKVTGAVSGMWDGLTGGFRGAINTIIGWWNDLSFSLPGIDKGPIHIPGFTLSTPNIPYLADGGIVTRPTLALIGEAGPEAVLPLSRGGGMFGGGVVRVALTLTADALSALERGRRIEADRSVYLDQGGEPA